MIDRQNLTVANGTDKCKGVITRRRVTQTRVEESVIDIVLISKDMEKQLDSIEIDEARKHVLKRIRKTNKESDHNVLVTTFKNKFTIKSKEDKEEIYNLKYIKVPKSSHAIIKKYMKKTKTHNNT